MCGIIYEKRDRTPVYIQIFEVERYISGVNKNVLGFGICVGKISKYISTKALKLSLYGNTGKCEMKLITISVTLNESVKTEF